MQRDRSLWSFLTVWIFFVMSGAVSLLVHGPMELHRLANGYHPHWADVAMAYLTHLADGLVPTALALFLWWRKDLRSFLQMALSCGISAIITQVLKRSFFADQHRPTMFRDELAGVPWVEGVELHHHFSFPSGHSTAAWAMCLALAVIIGRASWSLVLAMLASLLAYSRVYLSQHFTQDIIAGAIIGVLTGLAVYHWLYRSSFHNRSWLDRRWP
ncbi:MAG: phosphatase PAP2 family protein [Flavobacteriales bacterium]